MIVRLLRMQLALLPALWSLYQDSGTATTADTQPDHAAGDAPTGGNGAVDERRFSQADLDRLIDERLKREREKREREEERAAAEREAERLKRDQEWQRAAELAEQQARQERERADTIESRYRERILAAEARALATQLGFINPDLPLRLIDREALTFDDDGSPSNLEALVRRLAETDTYLLQSASPRRGIDAPPRPARDADAQLEQREQVAVAHAQRLKSVF